MEWKFSVKGKRELKAIICEFPNDYGFFLKPIMEALNEKT